jgi:phospholipase D1/2
MVVDDRAAIIGSANINERSMLGSRDSEVAAVVRDTDMIQSTMNGNPYLVGRFPHTLRMRLMREHLGIDVDELLEHDFATEEELRKIQVDEEEDARPAGSRERRGSDSSMIERQDEREMIERRHRVQDEFLSRSEDMHSFNHDVDWEQGNNPNLKSNRRLTTDPRVTDNAAHKKDVDGDGFDNLKAAQQAGLVVGRDSQMTPDGKESLVSALSSEGKGTIDQPRPSSQRNPARSASTCKNGRGSSGEAARESEANTNSDTPSQTHGVSGSSSRESEADSVGLMVSKENHDTPRFGHPFTPDLKRIFIDKDCMKDPVNDAFYLDTWQAVAEKNTKIYRSVFRCMPDSEVKNWKEYKEYAAYGERFSEMQSQQSSKPTNPPPQKPTGPPGATSSTIGASLASPASLVSPKTEALVHEPKPPQTIDEKAELKTHNTKRNEADRPQSKLIQSETMPPLDEKSGLKAASEPHLLSSVQYSEEIAPGDDAEKPRSNSAHVDYSEAVNLNASQSRRRRRRATTIGSKAHEDVMDKSRAEDLLNKVQGHLILWPYDWLEKEEQGGNWLYALDQISPLEIYN